LFPTGSDCETDLDGCLLGACSLGRNCTDLIPSEEQALGRGYNCTACPTGYAENGEICVGKS